MYDREGRSLAEGWGKVLECKGVIDIIVVTAAELAMDEEHTPPRYGFRFRLLSRIKWEFELLY